MRTRVLIQVEDPGAALFMQDLPAALEASGVDPVVMAGPFAAPYFAGNASLIPAAGSGLGDASAALRRHSTDVLVIGTSENPDSFAFDLVHAARATGIPTVGAVDSAPNAANRFRGRTTDPLAHLPDALVLPDRAAEAAYLGLGVAKERLTICGHPALHAIARLRDEWDEEHRRRHRARWFPDVPDNRAIFVFVSELSVGLGDKPFRRTTDYRLHGTSGSDARSRIVAEEFLQAARALASRPYLVLRLHPKQQLENEAGLATQFDQVSQAEPALEVVHAADLVSGMTSILLAEAATLGRPVLSIVPRPEERAWLGDIAEAMTCVWTRADIAAGLAVPPAMRPPVAALHDPADAMAQVIRNMASKAHDAPV